MTKIVADKPYLLLIVQRNLTLRKLNLLEVAKHIEPDRQQNSVHRIKRLMLINSNNYIPFHILM